MATIHRTIRLFQHDQNILVRSKNRLQRCLVSTNRQQLNKTTNNAVTASPHLFNLQYHSQQQLQPLLVGYNNRVSYRFLSSSSSSSNNNKTDTNSDTKSKADDTDENTSNEIVLTPGEQVVVASRLALWTGIAIFAAACAYYIGKELFPTKMSPNSVFDKSLTVVRNDPDVKRRYGDTIKGYGRDHGGHREGRRNFIEHSEYTDPEDGSKRTRVRYNIEGRFGNAFVFAEVSSAMPSGEFVYILVQDKSNGRVQTIIDNRSAITAQRLAGGNQQANDVMTQLLSGNKK